MGRYDGDIDDDPNLSEHGKYMAQFAKNHGIAIREACNHPTVKAHKEVLDYLMLSNNEIRSYGGGIWKPLRY